MSILAGTHLVGVVDTIQVVGGVEGGVVVGWVVGQTIIVRPVGVEMITRNVAVDIIVPTVILIGRMKSKNSGGMVCLIFVQKSCFCSRTERGRAIHDSNWRSSQIKDTSTAAPWSKPWAGPSKGSEQQGKKPWQPLPEWVTDDTSNNGKSGVPSVGEFSSKGRFIEFDKVLVI